MFEGLLGLVGGLKLHVGVASGQVGVELAPWHVNNLDLPVDGEDLMDVILRGLRKINYAFNVSAR